MHLSSSRSCFVARYLLAFILYPSSAGEQGVVFIVERGYGQTVDVQFFRAHEEGKKVPSSTSEEARLLAQLEKRELEFEEMLLKVSKFYSETERPGRA